jgi:hypothetical protein
MPAAISTAAAFEAGTADAIAASKLRRLHLRDVYKLLC